MEQTITLDAPGGPVVGTLALPPGPPAPAVLLLHGFTGRRDEHPVAGTGEGVFARTARLLADAGMASLRIDFRGSGDSPGDFADTTHEGQISDGLAALDWLGANPRVRGDRLSLIGWSMGGQAAAAVAGRSRRPRAVALWAPVARPRPTFAALLGEPMIERGLATGDRPLVLGLPWAPHLALKQGFFEGLVTQDPLGQIAAWPGPLFVAHGTRDAAVPVEAAALYRDAHPGGAELWITDMDHMFDADSGPQTLDRMVAATIAFLAGALL